MARQKQTEALARTFKALGDPTRLRIVQAMIEGEKNVSQFSRSLRISQPTVSRHLGILKMLKLADSRRDGKEIFYSLTPDQRRNLKVILDRISKLPSNK